MKKFVIISVKRTGSNFLCSVLTQHPEIMAHTEIFNESAIYGAWGYEFNFTALSKDPKIRRKLEIRNDDPYHFLDKVYNETQKVKKTVRHVGFKIFKDQGDELIKSLARDKSFKKIILKRKNRLKHYISLMLAENSGKFYHKSDEKVDKPPKINLNAQNFLRFSAQTKKFFNKIEKEILNSESKLLTLYYEDIVSNKSFYTKIQIFLGTKKVINKFESKTRKSNIYTNNEVIENYDEFVETLISLYNKKIDKMLERELKLEETIDENIKEIDEIRNNDWYEFGKLSKSEKVKALIKSTMGIFK